MTVDSTGRTPRRPSLATVLAGLALLISMSGTAWAAVRIDGKQLNNRSVSHTKLEKHTLTGTELGKDISQNVWATETSKSMQLNAGKSFTPILSQKFFNSASHAAAMLNFAEVQVTNTTNEAVHLTLRLQVDKEVEPGGYDATIDPGETQSVFAFLKCNGMPTGSHTVATVARADGVLQLGTRADEGLRPIVIPPGHSSFTGEG
jgi:hypothetical protein